MNTYWPYIYREWNKNNRIDTSEGFRKLPNGNNHNITSIQSRVHFVQNNSSSGTDRLGLLVRQYSYCLLGKTHFSRINARVFLRLSRPCHGSRSQYSATQGGGPGSVALFIWDLWWTKWHCDRVFSQCCGCSRSVSFRQWPTAVRSPIASVSTQITNTVSQYTPSLHLAIPFPRLNFRQRGRMIHARPFIRAA
jgi:hypothetical protein